MTYSILARDPDTGEMGVACQSQAFAVGSSVPWAMPGFGVIATQSLGEPMYGELGLDGLRAGLTAPEALRALRSVDPYPERRQVAMLDSYGNVDVYTGGQCVAEAGHSVGDGCGSVANMVASTRVWEAMVEAYEAAPGNLAGRLLAALHAAEADGGDFRGRRSAAILVVRAVRTGRPWRDQIVDVRVDDHADPVAALDRLVAHSERYHDMVAAFDLALQGEAEQALARMPECEEAVLRGQPDLCMWRAVVLAAAGRLDEARTLLAGLDRTDPAFVETVRRLRDVGLLADARVLERIVPER